MNSTCVLNFKRQGEFQRLQDLGKEEFAKEEPELQLRSGAPIARKLASTCGRMGVLEWSCFEVAKLIKSLSQSLRIHYLFEAMKTVFSVCLSILSLILFWAATVNAENKRQVITLSKTGLQVDIPGDWKKSDSVSGKTILGFYQPEGITGLHPNFSATLEDSGGKSPKEVAENLASMIPNAKVNSIREEKVGSSDILLIDISNSSILGELRTLRLLTEVTGKILVLSFSNKAAGFDAEAEKEYQACLRTLRTVEG